MVTSTVNADGAAGRPAVERFCRVRRNRDQRAGGLCGGRHRHRFRLTILGPGQDPPVPKWLICAVRAAPGWPMRVLMITPRRPKVSYRQKTDESMNVSEPNSL